MNSNIPLVTLPAAAAGRIAAELKKRGIAVSLADTPITELKTVTVPPHHALRASRMLPTVLVSSERGAVQPNTGDAILIPVDFSDKSLTACRVGFELAERLSSRPVLLHTYTLPYIDSSFVKADYIESEADEEISPPTKSGLPKPLRSRHLKSSCAKGRRMGVCPADCSPRNCCRVFLKMSSRNIRGPKAPR